MDEAKEEIRIQKEIDNLEKMIRSISGKLDNKEFTSKAPQQLVQKEIEKLNNYKNELEKLKQN